MAGPHLRLIELAAVARLAQELSWYGIALAQDAGEWIRVERGRGNSASEAG